MKKSLVLLFAFLGLATAFGQPETAGDNFSLEGALALFKKANSLEEFETLLNQENNSVNNLDLNNDGATDYIMVDAVQDGTNHVIILSTYINQKDKQDIATIGIEKTGPANAVLQLEGDSNLYAANTFVEPSEIIETNSGGKGGPSASEIKLKQVIINVWFWPCIQFIYAPNYIIWHSPWHWGYYPRWWKPWRPFQFSVFYSNCFRYRNYYHRVPMRRVEIAHNLYVPRRRFTTLAFPNRRNNVYQRGNRNGFIRYGGTRGNNGGGIRSNGGRNNGGGRRGNGGGRR